MVNVNKLRGKIVERGLNVEKMSSLIGIDRATFYRKLDAGGETFSIKEANLIIEALGLNIVDACDIFFTQLVA